jgi:hypothetical protein
MGFTNSITRAFHSAEDATTSAFHSAENSISHATHHVEDIASSAVHSVEDVASSTYHSVHDTATNALHGIEHIGSVSVSSLEGLTSSAIGEVDNAVTYVDETVFGKTNPPPHPMNHGSVSEGAINLPRGHYPVESVVDSTSSDFDLADIINDVTDEQTVVASVSSDFKPAPSLSSIGHQLSHLANDIISTGEDASNEVIHDVSSAFTAATHPVATIVNHEKDNIGSMISSSIYKMEPYLITGAILLVFLGPSIWRNTSNVRATAADVGKQLTRDGVKAAEFAAFL